MDNQKTNERLYKFKMADGSVEFLTIEDAYRKNVPDFKVRVEEIIANSKNKRMNKDGFAPGWQGNLGKYITCPKEYSRELKSQGLIEVGYDYSFKEYEDNSNVLQDSELVKSMVKDIGIELSGNEINAIESGEYFKD
jgi:hypothetical protein